MQPCGVSHSPSQYTFISFTLFDNGSRDTIKARRVLDYVKCAWMCLAFVCWITLNILGYIRHIFKTHLLSYRLTPITCFACSQELSTFAPSDYSAQSSHIFVRYT